MPIHGTYPLIPLYLACLAILLPCAVAQSAAADDDDVNVDKVVPVNSGGSPNAAYQVTSDKPENKTNGPPERRTDFRLDNQDKPCLRAAFKSAFNIQYLTQGTAVTKMLTAEVNLPEPSSPAISVSGDCGDKKSNLVLSWAKMYSLEMLFERTTSTGSLSPTPIKSWAVTRITLTVDTRNNTDFEAIVANASVVAMTTKEDERHFTVPANFSYNCASQEDIPLKVYKNNVVDRSVINDVKMLIWDIKMQGFDLLKSGNYSEVASCASDLELALPKQNIVPIAVAACLAGLIVIIVIVYFFVKNRHQSIYSSMD